MKDKQKIRSMFTKDVLAVVIFAAAAIIFGVYVLSQMIPLTSGGGRTALIVLPCIAIVVFVWGMIATLHHIAKHKETIYEEDLHYQKLIRGEEDTE